MVLWMKLILNALFITVVRLVWECFTVLEVLLTLFTIDICQQCACSHLCVLHTTPRLFLAAFWEVVDMYYSSICLLI